MTELGIEEVYCALARVPLFQDLDGPTLQEVARLAVVREVPADTVLFEQGDPGRDMLVVLRGCLQVTARTEAGVDLTLGLLGRDEVLGEMALIDGAPRSATVRAMEDAAVVTLDRDTFTRLVHSRPNLAMALLRCVVRRLRQTSENAADIAYMDVYLRLAKKLLFLAAQHGERDKDGLRIAIPLSIGVLATTIAAEAEGVERIVSHLESEGILSHTQDFVVIHDLERLHDPMFPTRVDRS